jgi:hypothetical protein
MGDEYRTFSPVVRTEYELLHELRNALEDAEYWVTVKPKRRFWYSRVRDASATRERLKETWGTDGAMGGNAVKNH